MLRTKSAAWLEHEKAQKNTLFDSVYARPIAVYAMGTRQPKGSS